MARRRKSYSRRFSGFKRRASRAYKQGMGDPLSLAIPAAVWGAARQPVLNLVSPYISQFGSLADEVLFGLAGYMAAKKGRGMIKKAGEAVLVVEAASIGHQTVGQMVSGNTGTGNNGITFFG